MGRKAEVEVDFNVAKVNARLTGNRKRAQIWLDNEVLKDSTPYVPRLAGELEQSGPRGTKAGSGEVIYNSPYARYQYYGKVMVGPAPKQVTDTDLVYSTQSHSAAGAFWFERAKAACKKKWIRGVKLLGGGK